MARKYQPGLLNGQKWRQTHQATIDAILGPNVRTVRSQGSQFYNRDNWTGRAFLGALCEWGRLNGDYAPQQHDVENWVYVANRPTVYQGGKGITIASTPDDLPRWLADALTGGGYHESWHTKWSRTKPLHINEVWPHIPRMWGMIPYDPSTGASGWAPLMGALMMWSNIIEDIRIERLGCQEYPGVQDKMEALQDLILQQEADFRSEAKGMKVGNDFLSVVVGAFRDLGLGYQTTRQKTRLLEYRDREPDAFAFVQQGPLKPLLDRAINMAADDDMGCIWLAMEVLAEIFKASKLPPPPPKPPPAEGQKDNQPAPPPPQENQNADYDPDEADDPGSAPPPRALTYKVGQRAKLQSGPHKGQVVEIVRAGVPDPVTGEQPLEFALVEED